MGAATGTSLILSSLTASYSVHTDASKNLVSVQNIGTGLNILQTSPTLITPILGVATGSTVQLTTSSSITTQGLHLQWNRSNGQGESWVVNQKGSGSGGIRFGEATTSNVVTETFRVGPTGDVTVAGNVTVSGLTASFATFADSSKKLVSRPGFSYQLWNAFANTGVPNNTWTTLNNMTKVSGGGQGELQLWAGNLASFRNDNGVPMLFMCTFTARPVSSGGNSWAMRILGADGFTLAQTEVSSGRNEICISATGVLASSQVLQFQVNQYTGFGQDAEGVRICITTYPIL